MKYKIEGSSTCTKCKKFTGYLAHLHTHNKQICNKCCDTSRYDKDDLFLGCDCGKETK